MDGAAGRLPEALGGIRFGLCKLRGRIFACRDFGAGGLEGHQEEAERQYASHS